MGPPRAGWHGRARRDVGTEMDRKPIGSTVTGALVAVPMVALTMPIYAVPTARPVIEKRALMMLALAARVAGQPAECSVHRDVRTRPLSGQAGHDHSVGRGSKLALEPEFAGPHRLTAVRISRWPLVQRSVVFLRHQCPSGRHFGPAPKRYRFSGRNLDAPESNRILSPCNCNLKRARRSLRKAAAAGRALAQYRGVLILGQLYV